MLKCASRGLVVVVGFGWGVVFDGGAGGEVVFGEFGVDVIAHDVHGFFVGGFFGEFEEFAVYEDGWGAGDFASFGAEVVVERDFAGYGGAA